MQDHFELCAGLVREFDRDRYLAALCAREEMRGSLFALYAFGAEIARIRDLAREPIPGEIRLQWWREVLLGERGSEATANPVAAAILDTIARYNLPSERLIELIEAHRFDIYNEPMAMVAELQTYTSKTDGTIMTHAVLRKLRRGVGNGESGERLKSRGELGSNDYSAATTDGSAAIQRSRSANARRARALLRANALAVLRPNLLLRSKSGGSASGGNKAKFTFMGWNEEDPASIVSI